MQESQLIKDYQNQNQPANNPAWMNLDTWHNDASQMPNDWPCYIFHQATQPTDWNLKPQAKPQNNRF